jgi:hypothetical protein
MSDGGIELILRPCGERYLCAHFAERFGHLQAYLPARLISS